MCPVRQFSRSSRAGLPVRYAWGLCDCIFAVVDHGSGNYSPFQHGDHPGGGKAHVAANPVTAPTNLASRAPELINIRPQGRFDGLANAHPRASPSRQTIARALRLPAAKTHMPLTSASTLARYLIDQRRRFPQASGDFNTLILDISIACKAIARQVALGALVDFRPNTAGDVNVQGEMQKPHDVISNEMLIRQTEWSGRR